MNNVRLNVLLVSYNASEYINECVESILMQKTNFIFNIIVADDSSSDDTLEKIKQIADKSTVEFIFLSSDENLGIKKNYKKGFNACSAEYIAILEGDDFWSDQNRLQKHVDFLDNHHECVMTSNNRIDARYSEASFVPFYNLNPEFTMYTDSNGSNYHLISARDTIKTLIGGNFSTCIYRKSGIDKLPSDWLGNSQFGDGKTNILVLSHGLMGYFTDVMNVYRIHDDGVWSGKNPIEQYSFIIKSYTEFNAYTNKRFDKELTDVINWAMAQEDICKNGDRTTDSEEIKNQIYEHVPESKKSKNFLLKKILRAAYMLTPSVFVCVLKLLTPRIITDKIRNLINRSA